MGGVWRASMCRLADLYSNGIGEHCQWYQNKRHDSRRVGSLYFLWANPSLVTVAPDSFTLTKVFTDIGWATARTGWSDDDYLFALKSGEKESLTHHHKEQNSFIFGGKGRWLIADAGYGRQSEWKERIHHNGLDNFEDNATAMWRKDSLIYAYYTTEDTFTYFESIDTSYTTLDPWVREVIFFNKLGCFVINDYAERIGAIDSLHWRIHSWVAPHISENDRKIEIIYSEGPNLFGYIVFPENVNTDYETLEEISFDENGTTRYFRRIRVNLPTEDVDTFRVVVGFAPYENQESEITPIIGVNFKGAKLKNEKGCAAALFGMKDNLEGGKYDVSVADSLLNIVCNLVPDTSYLVITKKGNEDETIDTLPANDVGILFFKLNSTGDWKVIISLARTTGEIKINQDQSYCNMPYVALNLESLNPFTGQDADSMKIWQYYIPQQETLRYTYSTNWIPFDSTYFWCLRQEQGVNKIYARFRSGEWNESQEYCDSIIFDKIAPTGSFVINDDSTFTNSSNVTLKNSLIDTLTSMSKMRFGNKFLENFVKNSGFDSSGNWEYDTAIYHNNLDLFEIPVQTTGNYFYQSILPESLAEFDNDTLLLWIDLVDSAFTGSGKVEFQYIYGPPMREDSIDPRGQYPFGTIITIPQGTNAKVSQYNLASYFRYHPEPPPGEELYEARVRVFIDAGDMNTGKLFIDNLRLDVVSPFDSSRFKNYDSLKEWTLTSGNGVRKVYGQFSDGAGNETSVLFDSIIVDTTRPAANISSPEDKQKINGNVGITGWAYDYPDPDQHFKQYELKYQEYEGADTSWYGIHPESLFYTPKNPSIPPWTLGQWNTQEVTDSHGNGWYYLKLTVKDSAGNYQDDTIRVYIDNPIGRDGEFSGFSHDVYGLAAQDEIYIGEIGTGKIYRYNANYQMIDTFNLIDSVGIGFPLAMAIDNSGKLWATNITSHLVNRFTPQGNLLLQFGSGFSLPSGIGFDNSGNIWVSDRMHHKIKKFNQSGDTLFQFGTRGSEYGEIKRPMGIALLDNKIYIADSRNRRISVFDTLGDFIRVIGESAGLLMPFGLTVDSIGCVFVSDFLGDRVIEFGPSGNQLLEIDSILDAPSGLALSSDANILYVSDTKHKRVLAFTVRDEPQEGGGPQSHSDVYINRLMFDVYPSIFSEQLIIRLQGMGEISKSMEIKIYDVSGRLVKQFNYLTDQPFNQIIWRGQDDLDRQVSSGVYFIRLVIDAVGGTSDYIETKKAILLK
ncbi:hypothetical protein KAX97_06795 [candidate division WOR-3 bacterium]|nr:hypothetical protein [candidate division WOR-3 bacterium]